MLGEMSGPTEPPRSSKVGIGCGDMSFAYDQTLSGDPRFSVWLRLRGSYEHAQELHEQILAFSPRSQTAS
jgi:hypothetical protein